MKTLRRVSILLGLGALVLTGVAAWRGAAALVRAREFFEVGGIFVTEAYLQVVGDVLWRLVFRWPLIAYNTIRASIQEPGSLLALPATGYLARAILVSAPVCASILAKQVRGPRLKWFALTFVFPFFLLGLVDRSASRRDRMLEGLTRIAWGMCLLAAAGLLWSNPNLHAFLVASQSPSGLRVPFFTAAGTALWLIAPYGFAIGGVIVALRGARYVLTGGPKPQVPSAEVGV
jgi:hypothetical protein